MAEPTANELQLMSQLKDILLRDDRSTLQELQRTLNERALLEEKINPILEDHLEFLRKNFPKEYASIVNRMVDQKIKSSQAEIVDAIYPVLGGMITKFINFKFQELKDNIDLQINGLRQNYNPVFWIRNQFLGLKHSDVILANADASVLEEIFIIERNSGLMLGSAALYPSVNRDVVAGMLTAIKSFVEDAFDRDNENLEMIQYGTYKIVIENFPNYYFAAAIKGSVSTSEAGQLRSQMIDFIKNTDALHQPDRDGKKQQRVSQELDNQFITHLRTNLKTVKIKSTNGND
jgi:hypothetical protein